MRFTSVVQLAGLAVVGSMLISGCSGGPTESTANPPAGGNVVPFTSLAITPTAPNVVVGQTVQVTATYQTASGASVAVSYASLNTAVATVNASGLVSAVSAGTAEIRATVSGSGTGFTTKQETVSAVVTVTSVANGFTGAVELTAGLWNTCARTASNSMWCWGDGVLGNGLPGSNNAFTPEAPIFPGAVSVTAIAAGWNNYCALTASSGMYCWGQVILGGIGNGTSGNVLAPALIAAPPGTSYRSVSAGWAGTSCALTATNLAYCWGENGLGVVGDGTKTTRLTPVAVQMPSSVTFSSISAGFWHVCALSTAQDIYCWGEGIIASFVGFPQFSPAPIVPTQVAVSPGVKFSRIASGNTHDCALSTLGEGYCHGSPNFGALGNGQTTGGAHQFSFVKATMPAGVSFTSIGVGTEHSCALANNGSAYCWGRNTYGTVGDGTFVDRTVPTLVKLPGVVLAGIAVGREHNCGWTAAGAVYCWGRNQYGQLGDVSKVDRSDPYRFR